MSGPDVATFTLALIGMPGVGKTTLSSYIVNMLAHTWMPIEISIDDVLRLQCPEGKLEFAGRELYIREGTHFLLDAEWRSAQMSSATRGLTVMADFVRRTVCDRIDRPCMFVLELPLTELGEFAHHVVGLPQWKGAIVHLYASSATRFERNAGRPADRRLPAVVVEYFEDEASRVDVDQELLALSDAGWVVLEGSTEGSERDVLERLWGCVEEILPDAPTSRS